MNLNCIVLSVKFAFQKVVGQKKLERQNCEWNISNTDSETDSAPECQDEQNSVVSNSDFQTLSNSSFASNISGSENDPSSGSDVDTHIQGFIFTR
jgi:hypothetical protein